MRTTKTTTNDVTHRFLRNRAVDWVNCERNRKLLHYFEAIIEREL